MCLTRLQLETQEKILIHREEREFQLRRELELKKLEAETAIKMHQQELQKGETNSACARSLAHVRFDVSKHISLVPVFHESEVKSYFGAFECIATALRRPKDVQCKLNGKAQEACSSLSVEDSLVYEKVKGTVLQAYELVPEAYRLTSNQTYLDFAREKGILLDRW